MKQFYGPNVDFRHDYDPEDILALRPNMIRQILRRGDAFRPQLEYLVRNGVDIVGIITPESLPNGYGDLGYYAYEYGDLLRAVQCGNEPDLNGSMTPRQITGLGFEVAERFPNAVNVGPGLGSGNPDWWGQVDQSPFQAIAVHVYGRRPNRRWPSFDWGFGWVVDLLFGYDWRYAKPIWVTEYGYKAEDFTNPLDRDRSYGRMASRLLSYGPVEAAFAFCYDQEEEVYGVRGTAAASYLRTVYSTQKGG